MGLVCHPNYSILPSRDRWGRQLLEHDWWSVGGRTLVVCASTHENPTAPAQGSVSPFTPGWGSNRSLPEFSARLEVEAPRSPWLKKSSGLAQLQSAVPSVGTFPSSPRLLAFP